MKLEYMSEKIPEDWYCHTSENTDGEEENEDTAHSEQVVKYEIIAVYWSKVGKMTSPTGEIKYPALMKRQELVSPLTMAMRM